ncbi:MAG: glycosyltransferase [bacterium]
MKRPVAILNMTRMGDLLMTGPMLHRLREEWPGHELHLIAVEGFLPIASGMDVDRVISIDFNKLTTLAVDAGQGHKWNLASVLEEFRQAIRELQAIDYEAIYNISHTRISAIVATMLNGSVHGGLHLDREGFRRIEGRWARNWFSGNLNRGVNPFHLVDMNIGIAGGGYFQAEKRKLHYRVSGKARRECNEILESKGIDQHTRVVAVQVGASADDKRWEPEKFGRVASILMKKSGVRPVFVGTETEREWAETAAIVAGSGAVVLAGETSLPVLAALLERSSMLITNDTGTMHLAQSVGTRSLDITLGAALSDETGPYGAGNVIIEPDIACFPCRFDTICPHYNCHSHITPELVAKVAQAMLENHSLADSVEATESNGVHLWTTGFDADGWWRKTPLNSKRLQVKDVIRVCYREVLKADLESGIRPHGANPSLVKTEMKAYDSRGIDLADALMFDVKMGMKLLDEAEVAIGLAENILTASADAMNKVDNLLRYSRELANVDERILQNYMHSDLWSPVMALFRFDLENIPTEGLEDQSRSTLDLHRRMKRLVSSMLQLISEISGMTAAKGDSSRQIVESRGALPRQALNSYEAFRRPRMRGERLNVVLPTSGYYLQQEIATALTRLGHRVHPLPFEGRDDVIERLLMLSREADLLITVNHLGFDQHGELANLLDRIELPYISWFVDRPAFILLDHTIGAMDNAMIATWEQATIEEIRSYGFEKVIYLPLATDEKRFTPNGRGVEGGALRWVANSMVSACREWQEKASLYDGNPLLDRAVALQRTGRLEPMEVLAAAASAEGIDIQGWDHRRKLTSASAIALTATRELRRDLSQEASPLGLQIYGDPGWEELAAQAIRRPPVEYPRGLAEVYRNAVHLNVTSYQMPTAVNQRVFDVPAAGGILITDNQEALGDLFEPESECFVFTEPTEIKEKIIWIRKNPEDAEKRSIRARQRILDEHTYTHRMRTLLEQARMHVFSASVSTAGGEVR